MAQAEPQPAEPIPERPPQPGDPSPSQGSVPASPTDEENFDFSDFFSLRKPRDARAGFASGLKSIAKGVVGGTASLLAAPAVYAHQEGWKGFGKGLAVGMAGAAVLPVVGVAVGATQIVRGVCNTPEAIIETTRGKYWDHLKREWVDDPPMHIATEEQIFGRPTDPSGAQGATGGDSAGYYEALDVSQTASPEEIKRQYYLLARKFHPDKRPDDPEAKARFQKLGEAYQVLADPQLRAKYDKNGAEGLNDLNFMDGVEFFGMLFGCEQFEYLVGELFLATSARLPGDMFDPAIKKVQHERVEKLATNLKALLERWVHGDKEGFLLAQRSEAERLSRLSFGKTMLYTIGRVYEHQGTIYQGDILQSTLARFRQKGESIRSHFQAAHLAVKALQAQRKIEKLSGPSTSDQPGDSNSPPTPEPGTSSNEAEADPIPRSDTPDPQPSPSEAYQAMLDKHQMEEDALPLVLEAMWAANVIDIQGTLKKVCKRVCSGDSRDVVKARAEGLKEMGIIFCEFGVAKVVEGTETAKQRIEDAMVRMVEKRHQMDAQVYGDAE